MAPSIELALPNLSLKEAGREARTDYLRQRSVSTGSTEIDRVLEGGVEVGNFYLFLGSAKNGKSTVLRCLGMTLAKQFPVLYVNFEQTGKNVFAKIYSMRYGLDFRSGVHDRAEETSLNIEALPDIPFFISFWTDKLEVKSFNMGVKEKLAQSIAEIQILDPQKRKPIVIMENLSDIYNERVGGNDNLVNIVTQTAQDIKNFALMNEVAIFVAHHTGKIQGEEPTLDDVRDSKRVVDLAHSIFCAYATVETDALGIARNHYKLKYIAGRGSSESQRWDVLVKGPDMTLTPIVYNPEPSSPRRLKRKAM